MESDDRSYQGNYSDSRYRPLRQSQLQVWDWRRHLLRCKAKGQLQLELTHLYWNARQEGAPDVDDLKRHNYRVRRGRRIHRQPG